MSLEEALKIVKLAGYRATKPKPKKVKRVGPTCVVSFADGSTYRMTTNSVDDKKLDWDRGIKLCEAAWQSRHRDKTEFVRRYELDKKAARLREGSLISQDKITAAFAAILARRCPIKTTPAVISVHFERDGKVIASREGLAA